MRPTFLRRYYTFAKPKSALNVTSNCVLKVLNELLDNNMRPQLGLVTNP